jgi:hypothetical protein
VVVVDNAPVLIVPVVPVPPPPDEMHVELFFEVHVRVVLSWYAMGSDAATSVTDGMTGGTPGLPILPPHEARPDTPASTANTVPSRILNLTAALFGMMESLREKNWESIQMCVQFALLAEQLKRNKLHQIQTSKK